jgi:hypothetical protein
MYTYVVTFTNASYVCAGEEPTNLDITVTSDVEPDDVAGDADVADVIVEHAIRMWDAVAAADSEWLWDDVDWTSDEPGWEAVLIHLPDGEVVDLG